MAGENRAASNYLAATTTASTVDSTSLYRELKDHAYRFDFFQALRLLENSARDKKKIGYGDKPSDDAIRFGQQPSLAFSPSTIAGFDFGRNGSQQGVDRPRLEVFFFGLFGPNGPLPLHLTEYSRERIRNFDDHSFTAFVDMFHHRLLSFFYRAWADGKPHVNLDRPSEDEFSEKLASLFGLGSKSLRDRDTVPDHAKYHLAGRFSAQAKNAEGLLAILKSFFTMPVELNQFVGCWFDIPPFERLRLGRVNRGASQTGLLGLNSTLGAKVWECQSKFTLKFGPLDLESYKRLLPGGASLNRLVALVRNYLGDEYDWDVQLVLQQEQIKPACLGSFGQLGWTSWLHSEAKSDDFDQLYLNPQQTLIW